MVVRTRFYLFFFLQVLAPYGVKNFQIHLIMNRAMALNPKNVYTKSEIDCLKTLAFIAVRPIRTSTESLLLHMVTT